MGATIFSLTGRLNPNILAEKMYRQQWKQNSFGLWVAPEFIKATRDTSAVVVPGVDESGVKFTGSPIEVFRKFVTEGKTSLDVPVRLRLTGKPVFGDKPLKGTEEAAKVAFRTIKINLTRKSYSKPTLISAQITLPYLANLMDEANDYLTQWWNDYHPGNFIVALTGGASIDLISKAIAGGRALDVMSHPHFYALGVGKVSWASRPGTAGYETAVSTAVDAVDAAVDHAVTVKRIRGLVLEAQRQRIAPLLMKAGFKRYAIWMSDAQFTQLCEDTDFKEFYRRLPNELDNHPLATGARADIFGAIIYVDQNMPHAVTNTNNEGAGYQAPDANKLYYWPSPTTAEYAAGYVVGNMVERRCTLPRKVGFLIGQSALSIGVGVPVSGGKKGPSMQFVEDYEDYGAFAGIGIATIQSVVRSDVYDYDGVTGLAANSFYENTSSLVFCSYSPDDLVV